MIRKPGHGWKHLDGPVWDHDSGVRLHLSGLVRLSDGTFKSANTWPSSSLAEGYIRVAGGNRKRGLMMWSLAQEEIRKRVMSICTLMKIEEASYS